VDPPANSGIYAGTMTRRNHHHLLTLVGQVNYKYGIGGSETRSSRNYVAFGRGLGGWPTGKTT